MTTVQLQTNPDSDLDSVRWYSATVFVGLFTGALFDQVALPSVAAGVEATGRIRYEPYSRALRSAASAQIIEWGDRADAEVETDRLRHLHRDVKGLGYNGVRYSALNPESWNWILISTYFMYRNAYTPITGKTLTSEGEQYLWDDVKRKTASLHLSGRNALPETYAEVRDYYDSMVRDRVEANKTFDNAVATLRRAPKPPALPVIAAPAWALVAPILGRILSTYSFGIMHPAIRELTGVRWSTARRVEFTVGCKALQLAHRMLPKKLVYSPMAYNRWKYEQLITKYRAVGLDSFAPNQATCPRSARSEQETASA